MGNIIGEPLSPFVKSQINARQKLHGSGVRTSLRSDLQLSVLNSNTSWVKMASGVKVDASRLSEAGIPTSLSGTKLARTYILNSGISRLEGNKLKQREGFNPQNSTSSYTYGNFGYSPMPGIKSVDVKTLNRGSIKKATVKLTANNLQQFNILEILYLRLGYTVILEWGNSVYTTNGENRVPMKSTVMEESFFGESDFNLILDKIRTKRQQKYGNYDGFIGKVSNFSWTVLDDGGYDIEITVISMGDVIESLKTNITPDKDLGKFIRSTSLQTLTSPQPQSDGGDEEGSDPIEDNKDKSTIHSMLFLWKYLNPENQTDLEKITIQRTTNSGENVTISLGYRLNNTQGSIFGGLFGITSLNKPDEIFLQTKTYEYSGYTTRYIWFYWTTEGSSYFHSIEDASKPSSASGNQPDRKGWFIDPTIKQALQNCNTNYIGTFLNAEGAARINPGIYEDKIGEGGNPNYKSTRLALRTYWKEQFSIPVELDNLDYIQKIFDTDILRSIQQKYETFAGKEFFGDTNSEIVRWEATVDSDTWGYISDGLNYENFGGKVPLTELYKGSQPPKKIKITSPATSFEHYSKFDGVAGTPEIVPVGGNNGDGITTVTIKNPIRDAGPYDCCKITTQKTNYYLRFGYLLQYIQKNVIPRFDIGKPYDQNPQFFNIDYSSVTNIMYSLPNQISLDPRVCIVRNDSFEDIENGGEISKVFSELLPWRLEDSPPSEDIADKNFSSYLMNVYLNFNFIIESFTEDEKGNVNLYEFIKNICDGINKAMGGINNIEPTIDEDKNLLKLRDTTPIPGTKRGKENLHSDCVILLTGYDKIGKNNYVSNFIRKANIKTAITPEYATMITVGATAGGYVKGTDATAFSKWNIGIIDRYKKEVKPANESSENKDSTNVVPSLENDEALINYKSNFLKTIDKYPSRFGLSGNLGSTGEFDDNIISNNISIASEYYKAVIAYQKDGNGKPLGGGTVGFIPFKISITMDGLSGIKIYNKITVDTKFLPRAYGDNVDLIVTGVSHRLQDNDWQTEIEATVMPKSNPRKTRVSSTGTGTKFRKRLPPSQEDLSDNSGSDNSGNNNSLPLTDDGLWLYLCWQQGLGGASQHYKIAKGKTKKYNILPANIIKNWPGKRVAANGTKKSDITSLYNSNPQKLAIAFIDVWKQQYESKASEAKALINSSKKNRNNIPYSEIKRIFSKYAIPNKGITLDTLSIFGYIENSLSTDTKLYKDPQNTLSNPYQGMFQINRTYTNNPNFAKIVQSSKKGNPYLASYPYPGLKLLYQDYDLDTYVKQCVPLLANKLDDFKKISGYPN